MSNTTDKEFHLQNWNTVTEFLKTATLNEVEELLAMETKNKKRPHIIKRLYTRCAMLKFSAEREKFMKKYEKGE